MQTKIIGNTKHYFVEYRLNNETIEILSLTEKGLKETIKSFKRIYCIF